MKKFILRDTKKVATGNDKRQGYELAYGIADHNAVLIGTLYMSDEEAVVLRALIEAGGAA